MNDPGELPGTVHSDSSRIKISGEARQPKTNSPLLSPATACFEARFRNVPWVWGIQVQVNLIASYWSVVSGEIRGDICTDVGCSWKIVEGFFGGENGQLFFSAQQSRLNNAQAEAAVANPVNQGRCHQRLYMSGYPAPNLPSNVSAAIFGPAIPKDSYIVTVVFGDTGQDFMECAIVLKDWNPCW
jgi:hypothetical protein